MKTIRNLSSQRLSIPFATPEGSKSVSVNPGETIEVFTYWRSKLLANFVNRKMVKVVVLSEDSKPEIPESVNNPKPQIYVPPKRNNKWRQ